MRFSLSPALRRFDNRTRSYAQKQRDARARHIAKRRYLFEALEDRRLLATLYVENPSGFTINNDTAPPGLSNGDTVTWNPGPGSQHGGPVSGLTFGTNAFSSIQSAVDAATAGNTILVGGGTYPEGVTVNKTLTILGNQVNADAQDGRPGANESIVTGATDGGITPFNVTANDVVLNGFTVEDATSATTFGFGILIGAGTHGTQIKDNIIEDNIAGISLANNSTTDQTVISGNLLENNNAPGPVSGTAIYSDQFNAGGPLTNVLIDNNTFTNNQNGGVLIGPTDSTMGASNITISSNIMTGNGNGVFLFNTTNSTVANNEISSSLGSQVVLGGGDSGISIHNNFITDGATNGIRIGDFGGGSPNSNITINRNSISGNATSGLNVATGEYTGGPGSLDARFNWWGSSTGPTIASNPGGTGDAIIDPDGVVTYRPFLTSGADAQPEVRGFQPGGLPQCDIQTLNEAGDPGTAVITDDLDNPGGNVLIITGTNRNDVIVVQPQSRSNGMMQVVQNKHVIVTFISTDVQRIVIYGQGGNDTITVSPALFQPATIFGGTGNDTITAGSGDTQVSGGAGNDKIVGGNGNDTLCGDEGNDVIVGGAGDDTIFGEGGNDTINGGLGNDFILGGDGNDTIDGALGDDRIYGQAGNDTLVGGYGNNILVGGDGNDKIVARPGRNIIIGGNGKDQLTGSAGDDILIAGSTSSDEDDDALQAILAEWASGDSYQDRVDAISVDGFNDATVFDDGVTDTLIGSAGRDWFWIGVGDKIKDRAANEQINGG